MKRIVVALGFLNACVYALLTPLWEGFDEPYHYGVVQQLARRHRLPHYGVDGLSEEVYRSIELAPAAPAVSQNHENRLLTFADWFALSPAQRAERRADLYGIDPQSALGAERAMNYQSQHAPLAYLVLAPFDRVMARVPLPLRIALLRLISSALVMGMLAWAVLRLAQLLQLSQAQTLWAALCLFQSQMVYATVCHIANDGLAVALAAAVCAEAVAYFKLPTPGGALRTGLVMAALLLTKSYGLAFLPVLIWITRRDAWRFLLPVAALAGPWYLRNWLIYGRLSGMFVVADIDWKEFLGYAVRMPWRDTLVRLARFSLFTGNNHFTSFHQTTIHVGLLLLAASLAYVLWRGRKAEDRLLLALLGLFTAAWMWALAQSYAWGHGGPVGLSPWYGQCMLVPFLVLAARHIPKPLALALLAFYIYLMAGTWWLKLIPLYSGFTGVRASVGTLRAWAGSGALETLSQTALAPAWLILAGAAVSTAIGLASGMLLANAARTRWAKDS